ncbi:MAG TPA: YtxH domain-containing protein [Gemmatimonadales bacterium]|nr:YtxH domain-containing protein [Gemmatimonadales bacterium]
MGRKQPREVVYVESGGDASARWLFWGACLGAGLALLYAPRSGEETRRVLQRRLWKLRAMTEEKMDELVEQFGPGRREFDDDPDEFDDLPADALADELDEPPEIPEARAEAGSSAREELERRLAEARARRRRETEADSAADEIEEPLA